MKPPTLPPFPFPQSAKLLVAVSGGSDSLALLSLLAEQFPRGPKGLVAVHVNYGLRGRDSLKDEEQARAEARRLHVPYRCLRVAAFRKKALREKRSTQDFARETRYRYFSRLTRNEKAWGVAVAHHAEDQAETVLDRLLRGAGSRGLSGLRPIQEIPFLKGKPLRIWRPLLSFPKEDLRRYLESKKTKWREDKSNQEEHYRRNQIRRQILPFLSRWNPEISRTLFRVGEIAAAEDSFLEGFLGQAGKNLRGRWSGSSYRCPSQEFAKMSLALRRRWVRRVAERLHPDARGLSFERIEEVIRLWEGKEKGPRHMGFGLVVGRDKKEAYLRYEFREPSRNL